MRLLGFWSDELLGATTMSSCIGLEEARGLEIIVNNADESVGRIVGIVAEVTNLDARNLGEDFPLVAGDKPIDSVALVEICVRLEDYAAE